MVDNDNGSSPPAVPKGLTQWLAATAGIVMGLGILSVQLYIQVATDKQPDQNLILAGVALLTAGTVAEIRGHKK